VVNQGKLPGTAQPGL